MNVFFYVEDVSGLFKFLHPREIAAPAGIKSESRMIDHPRKVFELFLKPFMRSVTITLRRFHMITAGKSVQKKYTTIGYQESYPLPPTPLSEMYFISIAAWTFSFVGCGVSITGTMWVRVYVICVCVWEREGGREKVFSWACFQWQLLPAIILFKFIKVPNL